MATRQKRSVAEKQKFNEKTVRLWQKHLQMMVENLKIVQGCSDKVVLSAQNYVFESLEGLKQAQERLADSLDEVGE